MKYGHFHVFFPLIRHYPENFSAKFSTRSVPVILVWRLFTSLTPPWTNQVGVISFFHRHSFISRLSPAIPSQIQAWCDLFRQSSLHRRFTQLPARLVCSISSAFLFFFCVDEPCIGRWESCQNSPDVGLFTRDFREMFQFGNCWAHIYQCYYLYPWLSR